MDSQQELHHKQQEQVPTTPPQPTSPLNPKPLTVYTYPNVKKRLRIKQTQIQDSPQSLQPPQGPTSELVVYEKTKKSRSNKQKRFVVNDFYENSETKPEIKSSAMERAEEIRSNLDPKFPSFAKTLVRSNVKVGFWMHLPMKFCKIYLPKPKSDTTVFVETENGAEFVINYIAERTALSGGWKAFIGSNNLLEGDVLIFHLVKPLRFKVYIVKGQGLSVEEGDRGGQNGGVSEMQLSYEEHAETEFETDKKVKNKELGPFEPLEENNQENELKELENGKGEAPNEFTKTGDDCGLKNLNLVPSGGSNISSEGTIDLEDFSIVVNGSIIDSELSDHCRTKYYELCCSQNAFLHENLLNSINNKLAAEIIIGTVNIAEAIRNCKLSGSGSDYAIWDKTLKGFELLGMIVGFLRARLDRIMSLAMETEKAAESEYKEIKREQDRVNEEMKSLELKVQKLKETREKLDIEIEKLRSNAERHEVMFQEVVDAPW